MAGIKHSKVWENSNTDTDNLQTTDNLLQLESQRTKPHRNPGPSQPTHQPKSLGGGNVPSPEDTLVGAPPRLPLGRSGAGLARGRVGAGGPPSPPLSTLPPPSPSSAPSPQPHKKKSKNEATHKNTHGTYQEEKNEKVKDLTPSLNAQTEVQCTHPPLQMWEPDQGGKIKNNLGINSEIYDTKPRKSEKNIFPEYELENQILTETTWAKSD